MQNFLWGRTIRLGFLAGVVALIGLSADVRPQSSGPFVWNTLPSSYVPDATYCPSNVSGCFRSMKDAEDAMRAAMPNVGQFLYRTGTSPSETATVITYGVKDQPPASFGTPVYGLPPSVANSEPFCPNSAYDGQPRNVGGSRFCASEDELVQNYVAHNMQPGPGLDCQNTNAHLVGEHLLPYVGTSGGIMSQYKQYDPRQRGLAYTQNCKDGNGGTYVTETRMDIYRRQQFICPAGFSPIDTSDVSLYPNICRSTQTASITIRLHSQFAGQCEGHPCHPASGDKSRAETDFIFAGRPFTRYYHSLRQLGPHYFQMGQGWTHTYSTWLGYPSIAKQLITAEGNFSPYSSAGSGHFKFYDNEGAVLEQVANYQFRISERNGQTSIFSSTGDLLSISDANRPELNVTISYINNSQGHAIPSRVMDAAGRVLQFSYGSNDFLTSVRLPDGKEIRYGYDDVGNLVSVDYGNGQIKRYVYGESGLASNGDRGLLTGIISEDGQRYGSFGYDQYGRVVSSVLNGPNGPTETTELAYPDADHAVVRTMTGELKSFAFYPYSPYGRFPSSVVSTGRSEYSVYGLDRTANYGLLSRTDANGVVTQYFRNSFSQETQRVEASNDNLGRKRTAQTDWHATLNAPVERRVLDANNVLVAKETWTYNTRGQVLTHAFIDPTTNAARTTTTTYCEDANVCGGIGLVTSIDGPRTDANDVTTYSYYLSDDPTCASTPTTCPHRKGDLWTVTNALGQVTETLAYDGAGRVLSVKDPNGVITDFTYTSRGWLASKTIRGGGAGPDRQTRIEYWPTGLVSFVYQPDNSFTAFTYDAAHRLTDVYDNAGNKIHYTLDNAGNRTKEDTSDPNGTLVRTLSRVYNQLGQLQQSLTANNHATTYAYDPNGNTTGVSDALGHAAGNAYDPLGRLVQNLQDTSGINAGTQFTYDANDHLTKVTDPKGLATNYSYNGLGDLTQLASPDTGTTGYTYDAAGNRLSQTDARGITANYGYDVLNRLVAISYPDPAYSQSYTYDALQAVCPAGEQTAKGLLTGMQAKGAATQYCYDRWGQLVRKVQTTDGLVQVTRYAYDGYGWLQGLTYPDGGAVDYLRNALGQVTEVGYTPANGSRSVVVTGITYAPFGPSTGWNYGNGRHLDRTLTLDYRPNTIQDSQAGGLSYAYGFDAVGNLGALKDGTQTTDLGKFVYDGLNRLTQQQNGLGSPLYTWNYDATGNRTQAQGITGGTQAYAYDNGSHHLMQVGAATRSYDAVGNTTDMGNGKGYSYGPDNRMGAVQIAGVPAMQYGYDAKGQQVSRTNGGATSVFAYDEAGHWLGEYSDAGDARQQVIWLDDLPVGVVTPTNGTPTLAYVEPDHLGTPRAIIDATRNVVVWSWPLTSEAFGNAQPDQDPDGDGVLFAFDLRFPGQRYDSVAGLNYNYFRDYEANTGRYVESDPIGILAGVSTYAYVSSSPFIWSDPMGLLRWSQRPTIWSPTYAPGMQPVATIPSFAPSGYNDATLARANISWNLSQTCTCAAGSYKLDEYSVDFQPLVLIRSSYSSQAKRDFALQGEANHIADFTAWIARAKAGAQQIEDSQKQATFSSKSECESAASARMLEFLNAGARNVFDETKARWDTSGLHTYTGH